MDRAPLPPHERPWRHPSELGPPGHEPTSTGGRVIIATAATLSLLLVGLLVVSMTPDRSTPRTATASTSGPALSEAALQQPVLPLVTPIGDDGWAITTTGAVKARSGRMTARLSSGEIVEVEIVRRDDDAGFTVVSLPTQTYGYRLASTTPAPTDTVAVHGRHTQIVSMVELSTLDVEEAAPVVDDHGDLVGLCSLDAGGVEVRTVSTMPGTSTTTTTVPSTTAATTVAPTRTAPPTTSPAGVTPTTAPSSAPPTTAGAEASTTVAAAVTTIAPTTTVTAGATSEPG